MSSQSRLVAGVLLILLPTVEFGRGEHPLAAHRRPRVRPEPAQAGPLARGPRPRGRMARSVFGSLALRGRSGPL
jgi:hypothetical protein